MEFIVTAGVSPFMEFYSDRVVYHPLFAMEPAKLLGFLRHEWERLSVLEQELITEAEETILRVGFLALLHSLGSVKQEKPSLPSLKIVQENIKGLFGLVSWKFWLESKRFKFPMLSLSTLNDNLDFSTVGNYIAVCYEERQAYLDGISDVIERDKAEQTEKALRALNDSWVTPVAPRVLWQWIVVQLPARYQADAEGWLKTLFLGSKRTVVSFDKEDIELAVDIIRSEMPVGTGVMRAVQERLKWIEDTWSNHYEAWEIEDSMLDATRLFVNGVKVAAPEPGEEPKLESFTSRGAYLQAAAKWRLAKQAWEKDHE